MERRCAWWAGGRGWGQRERTGPSTPSPRPFRSRSPGPAWITAQRGLPPTPGPGPLCAHPAGWGRGGAARQPAPPPPLSLSSPSRCPAPGRGPADRRSERTRVNAGALHPEPLGSHPTNIWSLKLFSVQGLSRPARPLSFGSGGGAREGL